MDNYYSNSSQHCELDPIKYTATKTIFPKKYLEYFIDYFNEYDDYFDYDENNYYICRIISREQLNSYINCSFCIENYIDYIPTIKTFISNILSADDISAIMNNKVPDLLKNFWEKTKDECNIDFFFRLNICSPKDVGDCKVKTPTDIIKLIKMSDRTKYFIDSEMPIRIVLREYIHPFPVEYRLFIHNLKLRAISQNDCKNIKINKEKIYNEILDFFDTFIDSIPYTDAIIDIIKYNKKWLILEINPFGAETQSGSALFNWHYDYAILYNSSVPIIRINETE